MKYYYLEPEVAGGFGKNTIMDTNVHPPIVSKLNYEFDGWLGDELLEAFPIYIATSHLADLISQKALTGFTIGDVEVSRSGEFQDLYPNRELPNFVWLQIGGQVGKDDFGITEEHKLVVSQTALDLIQPFCTKELRVSEYQD